jgi:Zn-dependent M16 (insulinase) family peptidase
VVNLIASSEALPAALSLASKELKGFGAPKPRLPASLGAAPFLALREQAASNAPASGSSPYTSIEVFASPSLQVGFAALALPGASYTRREHAAELVLSHHLSTGALWEDIRMKGGAYGAFAYPDGIEERFYCSTYRDPNPLRSAGAFAAILQKQAETPIDEETLEKAIIGTYAKETRPRTAPEKGAADFSRFLYGVDDRKREQKLRALVDGTGPELAAAARRLAQAAAGKAESPDGMAQEGAHADEAAICIIAGPAAAKEAAAHLGTTVKELPV